MSRQSPEATEDDGFPSKSGKWKSASAAEGSYLNEENSKNAYKDKQHEAAAGLFKRGSRESSSSRMKTSKFSLASEEAEEETGNDVIDQNASVKKEETKEENGETLRMEEQKRENSPTRHSRNNGDGKTDCDDDDDDENDDTNDEDIRSNEGLETLVASTSKMPSTEAESAASNTLSIRRTRFGANPRPIPPGPAVYPACKDPWWLGSPFQGYDYYGSGKWLYFLTFMQIVWTY